MQNLKSKFDYTTDMRYPTAKHNYTKSTQTIIPYMVPKLNKGWSIGPYTPDMELTTSGSGTFSVWGTLEKLQNGRATLTGTGGGLSFLRVNVMDVLVSWNMLSWNEIALLTNMRSFISDYGG